MSLTEKDIGNLSKVFSERTDSNCQLMKITEGIGGHQHKERMGHTFTQHNVVTEDNTNLVTGKDDKTLNATCCNCFKPGQLTYNFPEASCTRTCFVQVTEANTAE